MSKSYFGTYADGGSKNSFYKVKSTKHGFKGFPNKSLATFAHAVQSTLAADDWAPRVYSPVCRIRVPNYFVDRKGKTITQMVLSDWGYLTEIAKPYVCYDGDCDGDCGYSGDCENNETITHMLTVLEDEYGIDYMDAHSANLGYIIRKNKRILVAIDFGAESLYDKDGSYPDVCWDGDDDMDCSCDKCRERYANA